MNTDNKNFTRFTPRLDFSHVSQEVRSLVTRRRELMVFLGSLFVALSIYLNNLLHGGLPPALAHIANHAFFSYSLMLLLPSIIIALRIMRLHNGMTINGIFYAHILAQSGDHSADPIRASRLNWAGISTGLFLLTVLDATLASVLFAFSLHINWMSAIVIGSGCATILILLFLRNHQYAKQFALAYIARATVEPLNAEELEDHLSHSLQDTNQDMLGVTAFVGLILFAVMEHLSGLSGINNYQGDIATKDILTFAPLIYTLLTLITASIGTLTYRRLAVAAGELAIKLDTTDNPFNPFKLTDTLLGYLLLCVLFGISLHFMFFITIGNNVFAWLIEMLLNGLMVVMYPLRMLRAQARIYKINNSAN